MNYQNKSTVKEYNAEKERKAEEFKKNLEICGDSIEKLVSQIKELLKQNGYEYLKDINCSYDLEKNLRIQIEKLNRKRASDFIKFSDSEWNRFFQNVFEDSSDRSEIFINENSVYQLNRNGKIRNIYWIDRENISNNQIQFINKGSRIIVLINGIPSINIIVNSEWGTTLKQIFEPNNLKKYTNINSNLGKLLKFTQIFVISTGEKTKYFSNTTKIFEHASNWSYSNNNHINNIFEFIYNFFNYETIINIITKYCILDSSKNLIILRPYQIIAIEKIIEQINNNDWTTIKGGCIWHATGSGKTLTSFKTALLIIQIPEVKKVIFAVDRIDLYEQTLDRYLSYCRNNEKYLIEKTESAKSLAEKLSDSRERIIVTTVQKIQEIKKAKSIKFSDKKVVIIMDECHRSQTEKLHAHLKGLFNQIKIFGFTGTPKFQFSEESNKRKDKIQTTDMFGTILHKYAIGSAMKDRNILEWKFQGIKIENTTNQIERTKEIVKYILDNCKKFLRKENEFDRQKFNSIFATKSVSSAIEYYEEFEKQIKEKNYDWKIAIIYSEKPDNYDSNKIELTKNQKEFLHNIIKKHKKDFNVEIKGFNKYRNSISKNTEKGEIDILIVVDMFLTGFDAETLNTLWVDKYLEGHNLIQAFSRTNRVSKSNFKQYGNIVSFVDIKKEADKAFSKYSGMEDISYKDFEATSYKEKLKEYQKLESEIIYKHNPWNWIEKDNIEDQKQFCKTFSKLFEQWQNLKWEADFNEEDIKLTEKEILFLKEKWQEYRQKNRSNNEPVLGFDTNINEEINIDYLIKLVIDGTKTEESLFKHIEITPALAQQSEIIKAFLKEKKSNKNLEEDYQEFKLKFQQIEMKKIINTCTWISNKESAYVLINDWIQNKEIIDEELEEILDTPIEFRNINNWKIRENEVKEFKSKITKILN